MKNQNDYLLTSTVTVGQLKKWMQNKDDVAKNEIIKLIRHRFENRYIKHVREIKSGFLKMSIGCFIIETLQSFKEGEKDTSRIGKKMFVNFFKSEINNFPGFNNKLSKDFYSNIRCGILHQSETKNAWRILLTGPLLDTTSKAINAELFILALEESLKNYLANLKKQDFNSDLWKFAFLKLKDICENCK
ncbi:MAG: hypothetical protein J0I41_01570 [Filimonas sp.]|nr:hypothetical protein [Filimonas sp.]